MKAVIYIVFQDIIINFITTGRAENLCAANLVFPDGMSRFRRFSRSFFFLSIFLLLFWCFWCSFYISNDLAPKLRHITDIAIANKGKFQNFVKHCISNGFCRYYYPFLLSVCYLKKADFYALLPDAVCVHR